MLNNIQFLLYKNNNLKKKIIKKKKRNLNLSSFHCFLAGVIDRKQGPPKGTNNQTLSWVLVACKQVCRCRKALALIVSKIPTLESVFEKMLFRGDRFHWIRVDRQQAKPEENKYPISNAKYISVGQADANFLCLKKYTKS